MNGHGKFTWPDSKCYEGEYLADKKNGIFSFYQSSIVNL